MWEHVPLAWALITLATSESTQELLAEKELFHKVKSPWGGPGSFSFNFLGIELKSNHLHLEGIMSNESFHRGGTSSEFHPQLIILRASWNKKNLHPCNMHRIPFDVEHPSTHTKLWMFGAFIHVSETTDNEAGSLSQSAVEPSATRGTSFMCISTQEEHFGWSKLHVGALDWSLRAPVWCSLWRLVQVLSAVKGHYVFDSVGLIVLSLADVAIRLA